MIKRNGKMMTGTTDNPYGDLLLAFLPRVIKTETEYMAVQDQVDRLVDRDVLSSAERDYLELLGTLMWEYEARTEDAAEYELRGIALLRGLMELHGLKQSDLVSIFKTKSIVSAVLHGKRQLTVEHIHKLALFFKVSHDVFFEPLDAEQV
jgi:HTH-type transcriptional regulator/antitoxin HigA